MRQNFCTFLRMSVITQAKSKAFFAILSQGNIVGTHNSQEWYLFHFAAQKHFLLLSKTNFDNTRRTTRMRSLDEDHCYRQGSVLWRTGKMSFRL